MTAISTSEILALLPEIALLGLAVILLVVDPFLKEGVRRSFLGWTSAAGLVAILAASLLFARPEGGSALILGGMLRNDLLAFSFKMFFVFAAAVTGLFLMDVEKVKRRVEAYLLMLIATLGMCLMAASADLVMLYLAIETTSIPLYILAGFLREDEASTEAGFKYLLFGAMTSAVMLYGFSLLFGLSGQTSLAGLAGLFSQFNGLALGVLFLVLVGLGFKVSLVPFHFWAPDVYQGAPTPIAGFLSTASKAAGFAVALRLLTAAFPQITPHVGMILAVLATITMTLGNLLALAQLRPEGNIKRLLAYSSIAHAGYALIGVVTFTELGASSTIFYLIAYILTNLAAFGVVAAVGRVNGNDTLASYNGLSRRSPALAFAMLVAFLSLSGMPPFAGFVAKVFVFAAAVEAGWIWLAFIGVINAIIGLYYYLTVLKYVYLYRMENEADEAKPLALPAGYSLALVVLSIGIVVIGFLFTPWLALTGQAAAGLF